MTVTLWPEPSTKAFEKLNVPSISLSLNNPPHASQPNNPFSEIYEDNYEKIKSSLELEFEDWRMISKKHSELEHVIYGFML